VSKLVCLIVSVGDCIGAAIAKSSARGGFTVCLARRDTSEFSGLIKEIQASGETAHSYSMDAREEGQVIERYKAIETDIGPLETVISNVGGNVNFPIFETTERVFYKVWQMTCFAGFLAGREAARHLVPRGRGSIFFTGATESLRGASGHTAFSSAKFRLRSLAQAMKRELGPRGLPVAHLIIDSGVDTAFVRDRIKERGINPDESPQDTLMSPDSVGAAYWNSCHQTRGARAH
jgi:NAD(P)-dependent dehydrogenase (short-subunit alcohol dehydrogenase family)